MLIEKHISWLVINNVVGCPNNCKYCFLGDKKGVRPNVICTPEYAVEALMSSIMYNEETPVAIMVNTDVFATRENMQNCFGVIEEMFERNIKNQIVIVTKRKIPVEYILKIKDYRSKGLDIIVYVSYSGLSEEFEKGTRCRDGKTPLILSTLKRLHEAKIPCVHYWRPLIPQNSSIEVLTEVFNNVKDYCVGSVCSGLKLYPTMSCESYWKEGQEAFDKNPNCDGIAPKDALKNLYAIVGDYPVFIENICMLAYLNNKPCQFGTYGTLRCNKNNCPYLKLDNNPCKNCKTIKEKTCQENYWGNALNDLNWVEI